MSGIKDPKKGDRYTPVVAPRATTPDAAPVPAHRAPATGLPGDVLAGRAGLKASSPAPEPRRRAKPVAPDRPSAAVPDGPPVDALQRHGFHGSIHTFNERVQTVTDSYTQAYGLRPSPGLVFDLAKSS